MKRQKNVGQALLAEDVKGEKGGPKHTQIREPLLKWTDKRLGGCRTNPAEGDGEVED